MARVVHYEIYVDDPETAMAFYESVFGWSFERFEESPAEYWEIHAGAAD